MSTPDEKNTEQNPHVHVYDGIEELDNDLPRWWVLLFYFCIVFAVFYMIYASVTPDSGERYEAEMAAAEKELAELYAGFDPATEPPSDDPAILDRGRTLFVDKGCTVCHLPDGGGLAGLGPNLTDDYYVNGHTFADHVNVISKGGRPGTAMVPFAGQINPKDIHTLASFIWFELRGSTPANPKEPEGEKHVEEGAPDAS